MSQLLDGQTAFDCPEVTATVFKSRLDQIKMNIWNGKNFDGHDIIYTFHMIKYQYRGLPHAHLVVRLDNAHDIDDPNCEDLISFVNRHFAAEMPRFEGEEHQNVYMQDAFTDNYKRKAVEVVRMNNTHKCITAINGCKKDDDDTCKRGFSCTETISETYVNEVTHRIVYRRRMECDLKIVPYNLQMIMDWDSLSMLNTVGLLIVLSTCINTVTRVQQEKSVLIWARRKREILLMR